MYCLADWTRFIANQFESLGLHVARGENNLFLLSVITD